MKFNPKSIKAILLSAALFMGSVPAQVFASNDGEQPVGVVAVEQINPTTVELCLSNAQRVTLDFYGDNIFRVFRDTKDGCVRDPQPMKGYPDAQILVDNPRKELSSLTVSEASWSYSIITDKIEVAVCKTTGRLKVTDLTTGKIAFEEAEPVMFKKSKTIITLKGNKGEIAGRAYASNFNPKAQVPTKLPTHGRQW